MLVTFCIFLPASQSSCHSTGQMIKMLKFRREKGGKGERITVQSPPLPQLQGEGPELHPQPLQQSSFTLCWHLLIGTQVWTWCLCLRWMPWAIRLPSLPSCPPVGTESSVQRGASPGGKNMRAEHTQRKNLVLQPVRPVVCLMESGASFFIWAALGLIQLYLNLAFFFIKLKKRDKATSLAENALPR